MAILSGVEDVKKQQDTQVALLLRDGFTYRNATNKTVMVTANGHVVLTPLVDQDVALRFTLEQWSEIVEFVGKQTAPAVESWEPDWSSIPRKYSYAAVDVEGWLYGYESKPPYSHGYWGNDVIDCLYIEQVELPAGVSWKQTLRRRPGVSL